MNCKSRSSLTGESIAARVGLPRGCVLHRHRGRLQRSAARAHRRESARALWSKTVWRCVVSDDGVGFDTARPSSGFRAHLHHSKSGPLARFGRTHLRKPRLARRSRLSRRDSLERRTDTGREDPHRRRSRNRPPRTKRIPSLDANVAPRSPSKRHPATRQWRCCARRRPEGATRCGPARHAHARDQRASLPLTTLRRSSQAARSFF